MTIFSQTVLDFQTLSILCKDRAVMYMCFDSFIDSILGEECVYHSDIPPNTWRVDPDRV